MKYKAKFISVFLGFLALGSAGCTSYTKNVIKMAEPRPSGCPIEWDFDSGMEGAMANGWKQLGTVGVGSAGSRAADLHPKVKKKVEAYACQMGGDTVVPMMMSGGSMGGSGAGFAVYLRGDGAPPEGERFVRR